MGPTSSQVDIPFVSVDGHAVSEAAVVATAVGAIPAESGAAFYTVYTVFREPYSSFPG